MLKPAAALAALALTAAPARAGELSWLVGYWIDCDGKAVTESWIDAGSDTLAGVGLTRGRTRTSFDFMRIAAGPDGKPTFFAQPQGAPATPFAMKSLQGSSVVFENLQHDFPQRVIYRRDGQTLHARIEGVEAGKASGMDWTYRAAPANSSCPVKP